MNVRRFLAYAATALLFTLVVAQPAKATPVMAGSVTVTEHDSGFPDSIDALAVGGAITHGDGTNIGGILQDNESIALGTTTIRFDIAGGGALDPLTSGYQLTGYSPGDYTFSNILLDSAGHISSVLASSPGGTVADLGTLGLLWTDNSISLQLAGVGVKTGVLTGELLLTVQTVGDTTPVPEPASVTLLGTGLAALYWRKRKQDG